MNGNKKPPEGGKVNQSHKANNTMNRHSLEVQRRRLLEALRQSSITTLEARQDLDIMHLGGRVLELRRQ